MSQTKILFLSNNPNTFDLSKWLQIKGCLVERVSDKVTAERLVGNKPDYIISFNYSFIIKEQIINLMNGKIINLHISYLPWNRGANPNFWSFIEDTPKGITIHQVDTGLDTGDILLQEQIDIDESSHSFRTSYELLHQSMNRLFKENWKKIFSGSLTSKPQEGRGSYHSIRDFKEFTSINPVDWDDIIINYKKSTKI